MRRHLLLLLCILQAHLSNAATGVSIIDNWPVVDAGSGPFDFTVAGNKVFFQANGNNLYVTDGTEAGTQYLSTSQNTSYRYRSLYGNDDGLYYLHARYSTLGTYALEFTDGTATAPETLCESNFIIGNIYYDSSTKILSHNQKIYFQKEFPFYGTEPAVHANGSNTALMDIAPGSANSNPRGFYACDGLVFFTAYKPSFGRELWQTDGSGAGTVMHQLNPGTSDGETPSYLTVAGDTLYFVTGSSIDGYKLYKRNPITDEFQSLGSFASWPANLTPVGDGLYFTVVDATGLNIWRTNADQSAVYRTLDLNPSSTAESISNLTYCAGNLYFLYDDQSHGKELWRLDASDTAQMVVDLTASSASTDFRGSAVVGSELLFFTKNGSGRQELWKTNGTSEGTVLIKGLGSIGTGNSALTSTGTHLYFSGTTGTSGAEPWISDGTAEGTHQLANLGTTPVTATFEPISTLPNENVLFNRRDSAGSKLCVSDGTEAGTDAIASFDQLYRVGIGASSSKGPSGSTLVQILSSGNKNYFYLSDTRYPNPGPNLFMVSDGTQPGTTALSSFVSSSSYTSPPRCYLSAQKVYFQVDQPETGRELWVADTTTDSASLVKDIFPGTSGSNAVAIASLGSKTLLAANSTDVGTEAWITDGSSGGTMLLKDINPGSTSSYPGAEYSSYSSGSYTAVTFGPYAYFPATVTGLGVELWRTDGTGAGTTLVSDIYPGTSSSYPSGFTILNTTLLFTATDANGRELWITNGTPEGTRMVKETTAGTTGSGPSPLCTFDGTYYFSIQGSSGVELWRTNGSQASTTLVHAISGAGYLTYLGGNASHFYLARDLYPSVELWRSDGTSEGTIRLLSEMFGLPKQFLMHENKTYFPAYLSSHGYEIFHTDGMRVGCFDLTPGTADTAPVLLGMSHDRMIFSGLSSGLQKLMAMDLSIETGVQRDEWEEYR